MTAKKRYSYIKKPFSKNGWISFMLAAVSLTLTAVVAISAVRGNGSSGMASAAAGVCAMLLGFTAAVFTYVSLKEKDHNLVFSWIGGVAGIMVIIAWAFVIAG